MNRQVLATACLTTLLSCTAVADDLTIPNTFTAGTPARAAEVNDNFTAVEASVDDNAADIAATEVAVQGNTSSIAALSSGGGIAVFSQGTAIGRLSGAPAEYFWVISGAGYWYQMRLTDDPIFFNPAYLAEATKFVYAAVGCTGQTYVTGIASGPVELLPYGMVVAPPGRDTSGLPPYYVPRSSGKYVQIDYSSRLQANGVCVNENLTEYGWAAYPNDEAITGVSSSAPALPLTLGMP